MTDIVERLRRPDESNDESICQLLDDAADEIEKLRKWLKSTEDAFDASFRENERLREELEELKAYEDQDPRSMGWVDDQGRP